MNRLHLAVKACVPIAITLLMLGIAFKGIRTITFPMGLLLLVTGYALEKAMVRRYRLSDLKGKRSIKGIITATRTHLVVSSTWTIEDSQQFPGFDGTYSVEITELFDGDFSLISNVTIMHDGYPDGKRERKSITTTVDTGWLMFLSATYARLYSPEKLKRLIQEELKRLPENKPLCLWLKNENADPVGVVVSSGEGDGKYAINWETRGGQLLMLQVLFIAESSPP